MMDEELITALDAMEVAAKELEAAVKKADPVEILVLMPLLDEAVRLVKRIHDLMQGTPEWHLAWGDLMREAREAVKASKTPEKSNTSGAEAAAKLAAERAEMRALLRACQRHLACNAATEDLKALYQSICDILDR
jgi:hypothetical protein